MGGFCLMFGPFLTNTPISYMTGYFAENDLDVETANKLFMAHYLIWCIWILIYLSVLLFFWRKLISLLKFHMKELNRRLRKNLSNQWKLETLRVATTNVSIKNSEKKNSFFNKIKIIFKPIVPFFLAFDRCHGIHHMVYCFLNRIFDIWHREKVIDSEKLFYKYCVFCTLEFFRTSLHSNCSIYYCI